MSEVTVEEALKLGVEAHRAGKVEEADRYYTAIISAQPNHPDANHNIGVLAVGLGKIEQALPFFRKALKANPKVAQFWLSTIEALIKLDKTEEASELLKKAEDSGATGDSFDKLKNKLVTDPKNKKVKALEPSPVQLKKSIRFYEKGDLNGAINEAQSLLQMFPNSVTLHNICGAAHAGLKQYDKAIESYQNAIKIKPDFAEAYNNMGVALKETNNLDKAIESYQNAINIKPNFAEAYSNMGNALENKGEYDEAIECYKKTIKFRPNYADAYNNIGRALRMLNNLDGALEAYSKALNIKPDYAQAYNNIGVTLQEQGKFIEALEAYSKALNIKPDYANAYNNIGVTLQEQGKLTKALEAYSKALNIKPDYAQAHNNIGNTLRIKNKLKDAIVAYSKALSIKPDYCEVYRNIALIKTFSHKDDQLIKALQLYKNDKLSLAERCNLCFALAKMHEDIDELEEAFFFLKEANGLRKIFLNYTLKQDQVIFSQLKDTHSRIMEKSLEDEKYLNGIIPIFIVGMPRSGTTLVEQIISSHSAVSGAGELDYISKFGASMLGGSVKPSFDLMRNFRQKYLGELENLSNGNRFVTDKMPHNFRFISLICSALPQAKIIHVQRDAAATCWSNYKHYFSTKAHGYCYDLDDIVAYHGLYKDLMEYWRSYYNDKIYDLDYEALTKQQYRETKKMLQYLDLDWEDACMSPENNNRFVKTASQQQVRQKVFQNSSKAWKKYQPFLNGVFDQL